MKVTVVNYTQDALETLIFTKSTRLRMDGRGLDEIRSWPMEKKLAEWEYMQGTIKSSWEFVDYVLMIEGVTRAFTHQLVRHRVGTSFAQQTQRGVNMEGFEYLTTGSILDDADKKIVYDRTMKHIQEGYESLIQLEAHAQDARGILPTNVLTNICFKANLRTLNGMCAERLCVKAQGEFQDVMRAIRHAVIEIHPWAEPALRVHCAQYGTCAFPSYIDCPIKGMVFNPETGRRWDEAVADSGNDRDSDMLWVLPSAPATKDEIQKAWETNRAEAKPMQDRTK
jgi:flavin-dependent thymidylate synthase